MLCKKCNHEIPQGASFCTNCGTPAAESAAEEFSQQTETRSDFAENRSSDLNDGNGFEQPAEPQKAENTYSQADTVPLEEPKRQYYKQPLTPEQNPYLNKNTAGSAQNYYGGAQQPTGSPYVSHYGSPQAQPTGSPYVSHYGEPNRGGMNARYNEQYHQTYGSQPPRAEAKPAAKPASPAAPAPVTPYNAGSGTVSMGAWIGVLLLNCVPLVGIIMMFVWAFGSSAKPSLKNYARAALILDAIALVLGIILLVLMLTVFGFSFSDLANGFSWLWHSGGYYY